MNKKIATVLACLAVTTAAFAQGTVNFDNTVGPAGINAPVNNSDGTTRLGTGFWAQLYAGPAGTAAGSLVAVGSPVQFQVNATTQAPLGSVNGGAVTIPGVAGGVVAAIQMRAWNGTTGATYEAAVASGLGNIGSSTVLSITLGSPPGTPADLTGLTSFNLSPLVPEPATYALGLLGAAALLLRRRNK
jgi:hypothetical protein